jgi:hypothetical protein
MIDTRLSPAMREQANELLITQANKHLQELMKDPYYKVALDDLIMDRLYSKSFWPQVWEVIIKGIEKNRKRLERYYPEQTPIAIKAVVWLYENTT